MNENGLSAADVALLTGNNNNDGWGGNGMGGLIVLATVILRQPLFKLLIQ